MTIDTLLTRARPEACLSDLALDRVVTGEPVSAAVTAHLAGCELCSERRSELERDHARFPATAPLLVTRRPRAIRGWYPAVAALIAAAAVLAFVLRPRPSPEVGAERTKGGLALAIVARHADGKIETLAPNDALVPGDAIRFKVSSDRDGYLGIIGLDAKPSVTAYVPSAGDLPAIAHGRDRLIDGSIVVDDTLGPERIIAVVCADRAAVAEVVAAGQRALDHANGDPRGIVEIETGCRQTSFVISKVTHR